MTTSQKIPGRNPGLSVLLTPPPRDAGVGARVLGFRTILQGPLMLILSRDIWTYNQEEDLFGPAVMVNAHLDLEE